MRKTGDGSPSWDMGTVLLSPKTPKQNTVYLTKFALDKGTTEPSPCPLQLTGLKKQELFI